VLHEIYENNSCYNKNGISWVEEYTKSNLDSLVGSSIAVEFTNDERTDILGHGETGLNSDGSLPTFENATMVGVFTKGYIGDIEIDGRKIKAAIGDGYLDELRYSNFVNSLSQKVNNGEQVCGSVEIIGKPENDNRIVYDGGWKETGRIPQEYLYSGFSLVGIVPADDAAIMLELNTAIEKEQNSLLDVSDNLKEENSLDEKILAQFVSDIKSTLVEVNSKNAEYETKIAEQNSVISEINATVEQLRVALEQTQKERDDHYQKLEENWKEIDILNGEIAKAKVKEKVGELNAALSEYSEDEKAYAKEEIDAFNADPMNSEINAVVNKILIEVGKKAKEEKKISETNSKKDKESFNDIFSDISEVNSPEDVDTNIF